MYNLLLKSDAHVKDVIPGEDLPEYQKRLAFIHRELLRLNINIYLLELILQFPTVFFYRDGLTYNTFFESYIENALDMSVLIITRLTINDSSNPLTIERFQSLIEN